MVTINSIKEINMYHKLFVAAKYEPKKRYSKSDIGRMVDDKYPTPKTHEFVKRLVFLNILDNKLSTESYRNKYIDTYTINKGNLVKVLQTTDEYKVFKEILEELSLIRVLKKGIKD